MRQKRERDEAMRGRERDEARREIKRDMRPGKREGKMR